MLLTVAYAASIGGIITPVGTPPNLITLGLLDKLAGVEITFFTWMLLMTPLAIALGGLMLLTGARVFPAPAQRSGEPSTYFHGVHYHMGPWSVGQRNCAIAFGVAVVLWITPGALVACGLGDLPWVKTLTDRLDESVVAIVAASLLFVLPVSWRERRFTIGWNEASKIDWGTILLFGGGLSLGRLMFVTGLAEHVGRTVVEWSHVESLWGVTALAAALGILLTEITSNTAATNMLVPVVDQHRAGEQHQPRDPCARRMPGREHGVHAADLHAAQCNCLRQWPGADHGDVAVRHPDGCARLHRYRSRLANPRTTAGTGVIVSA